MGTEGSPSYLNLISNYHAACRTPRPAGNHLPCSDLHGTLDPMRARPAQDRAGYRGPTGACVRNRTGPQAARQAPRVGTIKSRSAGLLGPRGLPHPRGNGEPRRSAPREHKRPRRPNDQGKRVGKPVSPGVVVHRSRRRKTTRDQRPRSRNAQERAWDSETQLSCTMHPRARDTWTPS